MSKSETTPTRIQRSRTKGWRKPAGAVCVTRPGKWGNPFIVGASYRTVGGYAVNVKDAAYAVRLFRPIAWTRRDEIIRELRGKTLCCWCAVDAPCHADVLLRIANG